MNKVYERTENGVTSTVSQREGLAEISRAKMEGKRDVRTMWSISRTDYAIDYKDGRSVRLILVDAPALEGNTQGQAAPVERTALIQRRADGPDLMGRVVTVKGKDYVVDRPVRSSASGGGECVDYWSERNGMRFGATRTARPDAKPGTVARAIWEAVNR
ncbi:hypothetical protein J3S85_37575 [Streptomyces lavenduligriseus]|nr:hypothetical protein J3S85_37575 [Streptomyces lavenduligriseus]